MASPQILGDIRFSDIQRFLSTAASFDEKHAHFQRQQKILFDKGGDALRGVSDPMEKIFGALTEYIGEHGMDSDMRQQYEAIGRHLKAPKVSGAVQTLKNAHQAYDLGDIYHGDITSKAATSVAPTSPAEPTSRLRGTLAGEPKTAKVASASSGESVDMLQLAKKLVPDIEKGMPEEVSKAFEEGRIKTIFRTSESGIVPHGETPFIRGNLSPGSTYFLRDDGAVARYGRDGKGWVDDRSVAGRSLDKERSTFLDEALFFRGADDPGTVNLTREIIDSGLKEGTFQRNPLVGLHLTEFDSDLARRHGRSCCI